jgi:hypothetical protein
MAAVATRDTSMSTLANIVTWLDSKPVTNYHWVCPEWVTVLNRVTHGHHVTHTNIKILEISTINYSINMAPIDDALAAL